MLRSMFIGLAIAAVLQIANFSVEPVRTVSLASERVDWVQVQTAALSRLFGNSVLRIIR